MSICHQTFAKLKSYFLLTFSMLYVKLSNYVVGH